MLVSSLLNNITFSGNIIPISSIMIRKIGLYFNLNQFNKIKNITNAPRCARNMSAKSMNKQHNMTLQFI